MKYQQNNSGKLPPSMTPSAMNIKRSYDLQIEYIEKLKNTTFREESHMVEVSYVDPSGIELDSPAYGHGNALVLDILDGTGLHWITLKKELVGENFSHIDKLFNDAFLKDRLRKFIND